MGSFTTSRPFRRRTLALLTLPLLLGACGLNEREKTVAETNAQIDNVYDVSEALAATIYELADRPEGPNSFAAVIAAYGSYRVEVDRLNVLIHRLGGVVPELNDHLRDEFDPSAEAALTRCDSAVGVFEEQGSDESDYQDALTSICLCIERYAEAVTAVSQVYARLAS